MEIQADNTIQPRRAKQTWTAPPAGCYVPAVTFYQQDSDGLDLAAQAKYYNYLANTGLEGLVVLGTNAETFLLTRSERKALIECARTAAPKAPIIAGVSGHSTVQVLEYISDAYEAGADYVLLLPCAYFGKQSTPAVVKGFFSQVAEQTQLPIILYNFPAVCSGLDMDSELITEIARASPAVVGVKLTCGSVAKIARLAAVFDQKRFAVFGGQSDFLVGGLAVGSAGCIAAFANVFPKSVARLYELWQDGQQDAALKLQKILSLAESPTKAGIANTKYAAAIMTAPRARIGAGAEVGLRPRQPYNSPNAEARLHIRKMMEPLAYLEDGDTSSGRLLSRL